MTRVSILGAAGYTGGEVLRLLCRHPAVELAQITSDRFASKRADFPHPNLRGANSLRFVPHDALEPCDLLISCLPHGQLAARWSKVSGLAERMIDLSADFRLDPVGNDLDERRPPGAPSFVYALPEWTAEQLANARFAAVPGCMAHAALLAILPLVKARLVRSDVVVDAKTGSSGGGREPDRMSHHPERASALHCYRPVGHRHTGELEGAIEHITGVRPVIHFSATAVPSVRGVLATVHCFPTRPFEQMEPLRLLATAYRNQPFVRLIRPGTSVSPFPAPGPLLGTNECQLAVDVDSRRRRIVINAALDNLVKGAAGTAVHAMNLMLGQPETAGLDLQGLHPI